jgi:hypothetical protein
LGWLGLPRTNELSFKAIRQKFVFQKEEDMAKALSRKQLLELLSQHLQKPDLDSKTRRDMATLFSIIRGWRPTQGVYAKSRKRSPNGLNWQRIFKAEADQKRAAAKQTAEIKQ